MVELGFVLTSTVGGPSPAELTISLERLGIHAAHQQSEADGTRITTSLGPYGTMVHQVMSTPHPDRYRMLLGAAGPTTAQLALATNHVVVAVLPAAELDRASVDRTLLKATAAVAEMPTAVAARVRGGVNYFRASLFADLVRGFDDAQDPPVELLIGISGATESDERVSFLSSGLERFGRENFLITEAAGQNEAMGFLWTMARWMVAEPDKELPTGETVGRSPTERILIQRVLHPKDPASTVVRLDLPIPSE